MKNTFLIISLILIAGLTTLAYFTYENNKRLKADISHLNNTIDIRVKQGINDTRIKVTDSLLKKFENIQHDTIIKTKIRIKHEKVVDTIYMLPANEQLEYFTRELNRLYNDK